MSRRKTTRTSTSAAASRTAATNDPDPSPLGRLTPDPEHFAAAIWGRCASLTERRAPFDDLFSLAGADRMLAGSLRWPSIRMVRHGSVIAADEYCVVQRLGGRSVPEVADPRKVADLVAEGATLVLQSLHRQWEPLAAFADELMAELGHPVQVNAYLTPPDGTGLSMHADEHDVFAVQLHGAKCWSVDGLGEVVMRPGDVLYVPADCRHQARTESAISLHLTIGVLRVTYRDVIERVLCAHLDELDRPLPLNYRTGEATVGRLDAGLRAAIAAVGARLLDVDVPGVIAAERRRTLRPYARSGHLRSVLELDQLDQASRIRWVSAPPRFEPVDDVGGRAWMRLGLTDRSLRLPAAAREAIEHAATRRWVEVGELPGIDAGSRVTLARRLVREGACVVSTDLDA